MRHGHTGDLQTIVSTVGEKYERMTHDASHEPVRRDEQHSPKQFMLLHTRGLLGYVGSRRHMCGHARRRVFLDRTRLGTEERECEVKGGGMTS